MGKPLICEYPTKMVLAQQGHSPDEIRKILRERSKKRNVKKGKTGIHFIKI